MNEQLDPCPFCLAAVRLINEMMLWRIECPTSGCPARVTWPYDTREEAIDAWNERTEPPAPAPVLSPREGVIFRWVLLLTYFVGVSAMIWLGSTVPVLAGLTDNFLPLWIVVLLGAALTVVVSRVCRRWFNE